MRHSARKALRTKSEYRMDEATADSGTSAETFSGQHVGARTADEMAYLIHQRPTGPSITVRIAQRKQLGRERERTNSAAKFAKFLLLFVLSFVWLQANRVNRGHVIAGVRLLRRGVVTMVSVSQSTVGLFVVRLRWCFGREFLDIIRGEEAPLPPVAASPPVRVCLLDDIYDISGGHDQIVWFLGNERQRPGAE